MWHIASYMWTPEQGAVTTENKTCSIDYVSEHHLEMRGKFWMRSQFHNFL